MRPLSTAELLRVWDQGLGRSPVQRALALLAAACPDARWDDLAWLRLGQRDAALLTLREWTFGSDVAALATCPACAARLDLNFKVGDVRASGPALEDDLVTVRHEDWRVELRLPNSLDLAAAGSCFSMEAARGQLLHGCVVTADQGGIARTAAEFPEDVAAAAAAGLAAVDPQADVQLALTCPDCGHSWQAAFDVGAFFWCEVHDWAVRLLRDVHELASAYGWSEADVLALSPGRRRAYLDLVRG